MDRKFLGTLRPQSLLFTHPARIISYSSTGLAPICQLLHYVGMWGRQNLLSNTKQQSLCYMSKIWCTTVLGYCSLSWLLHMCFYVCMCLILRAIKPHLPSNAIIGQCNTTSLSIRVKTYRVETILRIGWMLLESSTQDGLMWQIWQQVGCNQDNKRRKTKEMKWWQII